MLVGGSPEIVGALLVDGEAGAASAGEISPAICSTGGPEQAESTDAAHPQTKSRRTFDVIMFTARHVRRAFALAARKLDVRHTFSQPAGGCGRQINSS